MEASHSPFVLPESRNGSAVYSLTGWPVQLLGENQIALVCPEELNGSTHFVHLQLFIFIKLNGILICLVNTDQSEGSEVECVLGI